MKMELKAFKIRLIPIAILLLHFATPSSLPAANFKIKPVVVSGGSAPGGETFLAFTFPALNSRGDIAFGAATASGTHLYLATEQGTSLVLKEGVYPISTRLPDPASLGVVQIACPFGPGICALPDFISVDFFKFPDGHISSCPKEVRLLGGITHINDSHDILMIGAEGGKPGRFLLSGGSVSSLSCPLAERFSAPAIVPIGITNSGTIGLFAAGRILLLRGGGADTIDLIGSPAPTGGTIQAIGTPVINGHEAILVPFLTSSSNPFAPQGLILLSGGSAIPVAFTGAAAPGGRTFTSFLAKQIPDTAALNNVEQVAFAASLNDGSSGIFRREPGGTISTLIEGRANALSPGNVSINDKGDVAATVVFSPLFRPTWSIMLFDSRGNSSKVISQGDPAPGGGTFLFIGIPNINNKGEVVFFAFLSNGKIGIFKAGRGLETEFVDPVPDLLVGPAVTSDTAMLAKNGRVVTGIAADGAAQVVIRVKTGQTGTTEFSLVDESGVALPGNNFNGSLSQVGATPGSSTVSVQVQDVTGVGPMAFAAYHAPMDFSSSPDSAEAGLPDRQVFIKVKLTTSTGETIESTSPLKIVRPPVVLVHGLWGSSGAWDGFSPLTTDTRFFIKRVDYRRTHGAFFAVNAPKVGDQIVSLIKNYKEATQVAAVQADVITHSMGGLLVRMQLLVEDSFFREDNFNLGDVHKLINIDTPHLGTPLARFLQLSPCISRFFDSHDHPTDQGAVENLIPGSRALREINSVPSSIELHNIVGLTGIAGIELTEGSPAYLWLRLRCRRDFRGIPVSGFFDVVLGTPDHDLIVPGVSQQGRATTNVTTIIGVIHTQVEFFFQGVGVLESTDASNRVINLLNTPINSLEFDTFVGFP